MDLNSLTQNPEQIKQLIAALQQLLPKEQNSNDTETEQSEFVSPIRTKGSRKFQGPKRPNLFTDMPERNMHKEDIEIDKMLCKNPPVARAREFTTVQVKCRVCGTTEDVNPSLLTADSSTRYKCNKCSTSAG